MPSHDTARVLASRLLHLRNQSGISQMSLATKTGIGQATLSRLEAGGIEPGDMRWKTIAALADFHDLPVDYLMGRRPVAKWLERLRPLLDPRWCVPRNERGDQELYELTDFFGLYRRLSKDSRDRVQRFAQFEASDGWSSPPE